MSLTVLCNEILGYIWSLVCSTSRACHRDPYDDFHAAVLTTNMTRRITRTLTQLVALLALVFLLVFLADIRFSLLPSTLHSFSPVHHAGTVIVDITLTTCSTLNPLTSCRLDPSVWHRVETDLYLGSGWVKTAWIHVQRKREEELGAGDRVVVGVRIGRLDPSVGEKGQHEERWEARPGGLWMLRSSRKHDSDTEKAVTGVDVLFGADAVDPRPGWTMLQTPMLIETAAKGSVARLSVRHGRVVEHKRVAPRVRKDGRFKILQVSDLHLSTGTGVCRDAIGADNAPIASCEADPRTLEFLDAVLDDELPDLVVLSGDQIEGPSAPDTQSALFKFAAPLIERNIPYTAIFGNHDDEGSVSLSRAEQMGLLQTLPLSLSQPGPQNVDGVGNYYIEVLAPSPSQHSALTLYMLDTHSLTPDEKQYKGYDWLKPSQVSWFRSTFQSLKKEHAKYSHIHLDMAFIHIPLPEFAEQGVRVAGGKWREGVTAPKFNSHFYDELAEAGVVSVGCGHDHVNDYCALRPLPSSHTERRSLTGAHGNALREEAHSAPHPIHEKRNHLGPWMCYAGGSGFGGYGGYGGYHRRMRVWEVDTNSGRVTTWKRLECCGEETRKRVDELVIVEGGVVVQPS